MPGSYTEGRRVLIRNDKTGEEYAVTPSAYSGYNIGDDVTGRRTYEEAGFSIVSWEDGEPYEPPKRPKADG